MKTLLALFTPNPGEIGLGAWDGLIPPSLRENSESSRRARLHIRFGALGCIFGTIYALLYALIGHWWGVGIIVACSAIFAMIPLLVSRIGSLRLTGHILAGTLLSGFFALCTVEGGIRGHAVAWLAIAPICLYLLLEPRPAFVWSIVCLLATVALGAVDLLGPPFPKTYDLAWDPLINFAGYVGLIPFMALLGIIFERTRAHSHAQLVTALGELSSANTGLVRLHQEKDEFFNIAAHDLKNPLFIIMGNAELLEVIPNLTTETNVKFSSVIRGQTRRMLDIISNLLDIQRIEDGLLTLEPVRCDSGEILNTVLQLHQPAAASKSITLLPPELGTPITILADPTALSQILDNLVSNAVKYSPRATTVRTVICPVGGVAEISVIDEGPGLSAEDQGKLFRKFSKLTPRPTAGESSNGLGLYIVKRMAVGMNGDVSCVSAQGKGTTFTLSLPIAPSLQV